MRRMGGRRVRRSTGAHADINARMISSPRSRNHPRFVTGAHASHQTPARRSCAACAACDAWAVLGRASGAGSIRWSAGARPPNGRPSSPAPMRRTKHRRVARAIHAIHAGHGQSSGRRRPPVGPRRPQRYVSGTGPPDGVGPNRGTTSRPNLCGTRRPGGLRFGGRSVRRSSTARYPLQTIWSASGVVRPSGSPLAGRRARLANPADKTLSWIDPPRRSPPATGG